MPEKDKLIVEMPTGITASIENGLLSLEKAGKKITMDFSSPDVSTTIEGQVITFNAINLRRKVRSVLFAYAAHARNMIEGLETGFTYKLAVVNSHFPMSVKVVEKHVEISNYLGEKKSRIANIVGDASVNIKGKEITVKGTYLEDVSQTAANMEKVTRVRNKDQRVFQDGIYITAKGVDV